MNRNRSRGPARLQRAAPQPQQRQSTIPYASKNVPRVPPVVKANLRRNIVLVGRLVTDSVLGEATYTAVEVRSLISAQCSLSSGYRYQILKVFAWAGSDDSTSFYMTDSVSGITSTDSGAYTDRAHVGIHYPPASRTTFQDTGSETILAFKSGKSSAQIELHVSVELWTDSTPSVTEPTPA